MTKRPAFQFYPGDWLGSQRVSLLTLEEEGAYLRLLASCWQHGSIPSDPEKIARLIGKGASTTLATTLATMFQPHPLESALLVHDRLEREREKQDAWAEKSREGGRKSAEKRQNLKGGSTTLQPPLVGCLPNGSNQKATLLLQSTSTNTSSNEEVGVEFPANLKTSEFEKAWKEYLEYRKNGRMKSLLPTSQVAQLKKMSEWGHDAAIKAINESISQGWQGIFEPKATFNGKQQKPRAASCL
jgi:uncharacterized protein YdaU (DUF1376 family)